MKKHCIALIFAFLFHANTCFAIREIDVFLRPYFINYLLVLTNLKHVPGLVRKLSIYFSHPKIETDESTIEYAHQIEALLEGEELAIAHNVINDWDAIKEQIGVNQNMAIGAAKQETIERVDKRLQKLANKENTKIEDDIGDEVCKGFIKTYNNAHIPIQSNNVTVKKIKTNGRDIKNLFEFQFLENNQASFCMAKSYKSEEKFLVESKRIKELKDFVASHNTNNPNISFIEYKGTFTIDSGTSFLLMSKAEGETLFNLIAIFIHDDKTDAQMNQFLGTMKYIGALVGKKFHAPSLRLGHCKDGFACYATIHHDLHWANMVWDDAKKTLGILDYAEMIDTEEAAADLKRDLMAFFYLCNIDIKYHYRTWSLADLNEKEKSSSGMNFNHSARVEEWRKVESPQFDRLDKALAALKEGYLSAYIDKPDVYEFLDKMISGICEAVDERLPPLK